MRTCAPEGRTDPGRKCRGAYCSEFRVQSSEFRVHFQERDVQCDALESVGASMNVMVSWSGHALYFIMFMVGHTAALAQYERHLLSWRASLPPARALRLRNASQEAARLTLWLFWVSRSLSAQLDNLVIRALHDPSVCRRTRPTCSVL